VFVKTTSYKQVPASVNHRKFMKAEPSRLILRKLAANLDLLIADLMTHIQTDQEAGKTICLMLAPHLVLATEAKLRSG